jgi:GT2 family glycosyltransferase
LPLNTNNKNSIDIIIINYNNFELTGNCINSIKDSYKSRINIYVIDNNSTDGSVEQLKNSFPEIEIISNSANLGYAYAVNRGFRASKSEIVIISNNDVVYPPDSISNLIEPFYSMENIGVIGPQQMYPDGKWQYSYGTFPGIKIALMDLLFITYFSHLIKKIQWKLKISSNEIKPVEYIDGAIMAINRDAFQDVNGFDEDYFFYTEEADFCCRLKKKGWKILFNPNSEVIHVRGGSTSRMGLDPKNIEMFISSKIKFCNKHLNTIETKLFIFLEKFHHFLLAYFFKILDFVFNEKMSIITRKKLIFGNLYDGWRNVSK